MKVSAASWLVAALAAKSATAHYIFQQFTAGSTKYPVYQYIRKNSNMNSPVTDLTSNDLRCNVGASGSGTDTVAMTAGESFTFTLDTPVYHQGPISIYMSKAPSDASSYDGSGGWFKIKDFAPDFSSGQAVWPMYGSYTFQIPSCIANGDYLLRIQSLAIHNPWPAGIPQFYIECAQITVSGATGSLTPSTVLIPGAFKDTDPGYTANIYSNFNSYTVPGPAPISCSGGGSNPPPPPASTTSKVATPTTSKATIPSSSSSKTTMTTSIKTSSSSAPASQPSGNCAAKFAQCGGSGWTGATCCVSSTCTKSNDYYSQCL